MPNIHDLPYIVANLKAVLCFDIESILEIENEKILNDNLKALSDVLFGGDIKNIINSEQSLCIRTTAELYKDLTKLGAPYKDKKLTVTDKQIRTEIINIIKNDLELKLQKKFAKNLKDLGLDMNKLIEFSKDNNNFRIKIDSQISSRESSQFREPNRSAEDRLPLRKRYGNLINAEILTIALPTLNIIEFDPDNNILKAKEITETNLNNNIIKFTMQYYAPDQQHVEKIIRFLTREGEFYISNKLFKVQNKIFNHENTVCTRNNLNLRIDEFVPTTLEFSFEYSRTITLDELENNNRILDNNNRNNKIDKLKFQFNTEQKLIIQDISNNIGNLKSNLQKLIDSIGYSLDLQESRERQIQNQSISRF